MTFDLFKVQPGREPCWVAELIIPRCSRTYGEGQCRARSTASQTNAFVDLPGTDEYIRIPDGSLPTDDWNESPDIVGTTFTVHFWYRGIAKPLNGNIMFLVGHTNGSHDSGQFSLWITPEGYVAARLETGSGAVTLTGSKRVDTNTSKHIALTYDAALGSDQLKLYINGELDESGSQGGSIISLTSYPLYVGWCDGSGVEYLEGEITKLAVWSKALTLTELIEVSFTDPDTLDADLVGSWPMDEGSGTTVANAVTGDDGALKGTAPGWSTQVIRPQTGTVPCFNFSAGCQDPTFFDEDPSEFVIRFSEDVALPPPGSRPWIQRVDITPAELNPKGGLGSHVSGRIIIQDAASAARDVDPYVAARGVQHQNVNMFLKKLKNMVKYFRGMQLRLRFGFVNAPFSWGNFRDLLFDVEDFVIGTNNQAEIVFKDIIKRTRFKAAKWPTLTTGQLSLDMTDADVSFDLSSDSDPTEYPASGEVTIGSEMMSFTRSGSTFSVVRGINGTEATDHSAGDDVINAGVFTDTTIDSALETLLLQANIPASLIPSSDIADEVDDWWPFYRVNWKVPKPTGVDELIDRLLLAIHGHVYYSVKDAEMKLVAVKPPDPANATILTDEQYIQDGTFSYEELGDDQVTQLWAHYAIINPLDDWDDANNYDLTRISQDADAESALEYGRESIEDLFCPMFAATDGDNMARDTGGRIVAQFRDPPLLGQVNVDMSIDLDIGDIVTFRTRDYVDASGPVDLNAMIIAVRPVKGGSHHQYHWVSTGYNGRYLKLMEEGVDSENFEDATAEELQRAGYLSDENGRMLDSSLGFRLA